MSGFHYLRGPIDQPFLLPVEDVFSITGRGDATGRIESIVKTGEPVEIVGLQENQ